jgi:hypothetical protein
VLRLHSALAGTQLIAGAFIFFGRRATGPGQMLISETPGAYRSAKAAESARQTGSLGCAVNLIAPIGRGAL